MQMAKPRTRNLPDLSGLLEPTDSFMRDVQRALLRRSVLDTPSLSIAEQIAAGLAGLIALDRLRPGQRVLEEEICAVLGVSRAPVREALRMLERDRLLVVVPRKGAHVSGYNAQELHDIFEVRGSLFATLFQIVVGSRLDEFEGVLAAGVAELEAACAAASRDAYALASFQLIMRLCALCDNRLLSDIVQSLALQTLRYARLGFSAPGAIERSLGDWRSMLHATQRGEPDQVPALARTRIAGSRDAALAVLRLDNHFEEEEKPDGSGTRRSICGTGVAPRARAAARRRGGAAQTA
jgi:DNA-binding GntR family transcriptional regulator